MNEVNSKQDYLYFAYGSNMSSEQMEQRFIEGPAKLKELNRWPLETLTVEKISYLGKGIVRNYELNFHKKRMQSTNFEGFANISPKENSQVDGVVYGLKETHLHVLDYYEGVKIEHYTRETATVEINSTKESRQAVVYIAHPTKIDERCKPSKVYMEKLIKGAREFQLNAEFIQRLEQWPTTD